MVLSAFAPATEWRDRAGERMRRYGISARRRAVPNLSEGTGLDTPVARHEIVRVRHELRRRSLTVQRTEYVTPGMLRLTLGGDQLEGFISPAPDDHIKIYAPDDVERTAGRDFTPRRRVDPGAGELLVDFALHPGGRLTDWALAARPGDAAAIAGPRGSALVAHDFDWWLLIGDETALPAIGRRIEELPADTPVVSIVSVSGRADEQRFETSARHRAVWVHRSQEQADDPLPLLDALRQHARPDGEGYVWIAAEGTVARALRQYVVEEWHHPPAWMKASAYWFKGEANSARKLDH